MGMGHWQKAVALAENSHTEKVPAQVKRRSNSRNCEITRRPIQGRKKRQKKKKRKTEDPQCLWKMAA